MRHDQTCMQHKNWEAMHGSYQSFFLTPTARFHECINPLLIGSGNEHDTMGKYNPILPTSMAVSAPNV